MSSVPDNSAALEHRNLAATADRADDEASSE